jgi:hypothetical protein
MARILPCLLVCLALLCAACGGGENAADQVNREATFIPDVTTPEGATETYARAIETSSITLAELVVLDEERETVLSQFRANFQASEQQGVKWRLKITDAQELSDSLVQAKVQYIGLKDGKEQGREVSWIVFKKIEDGTWRYSRALSMQLIEQMKPKPPANGDDAPAGNGESANSPCGG